MMIDDNKLHALLGKLVNEVGAAANAALVHLGDKLGLFRSLAAHGPATPAELAERTGTAKRYVQEWLAAQAASGLIEYDAAKGRFLMTPEQIAALADEDSPVFMGGGFESLAAVYAGAPRLTEAFRTGEGVGWDQHCGCLFCGTARFFRSGYRAHLISDWLPALDGVVEKLERGARVADVGCGHGASTLMMAEAFPNSEFIGFDYHEGSVAHAREAGKDAPNLRFATARAQQFPGRDYDLVAMFDALHDMGDPVGATRHARGSLRRDGTLMLVEPMANDRLEANLNPISRSYYAFSTQLCVPASLSQDVGLALGAQAGEARIADVVRAGGFRSVRRAAETPFNMVIEARP
ncbi:MAG: crosslink repair DNA glycosylase YcaQ family protein [Beijerinckiaceae bacterium]